MKKYIYSNRKEIEMKNANQNNVNELNNLNRKETKLTKIKECIDFPPESKQDSFFIKKKSNIGNYAFHGFQTKKSTNQGNRNGPERRPELRSQGRSSGPFSRSGKGGKRNERKRKT